MSEKVKGFWIRRNGCMWGGEVCSMSISEFHDKLQAFADESGSPYPCDCRPITRRVGDLWVNIWYDENFGAYCPAPSGMATDYEDMTRGMLFVVGVNEEGETVSLTDEQLKAVKDAYYVPTLEELEPFGKVGGPLLVIDMIGFKLLHYNVFDKEEEKE